MISIHTILDKIYEHRELTANMIRSNLRPGQKVKIILKKDQRTGKITVGIIKDILSPGVKHTRGIKVRLTTGQVGRVTEIIDD